MDRPQLKPNTKVRDAVNVILAELNDVSGSNRQNAALTVLDVLRHEHRTLQQGFITLMLLVLVGYADFDADLRNEQAVDFAKDVKRLAEAKGMDRGLAYL